MKSLADAALKRRSRTFNRMYSETGRPSVPPERLLKAMLLVALYSVRSESQFCEQLDDNLLFRWFLDRAMAEPAFDHSALASGPKTMTTAIPTAGPTFAARSEQRDARIEDRPGCAAVPER